LIRLDLIFFADRDVFDFPAEFIGDDLGRVGVERAVDVHAGHAQAHELHEHFGRLDLHLAGQHLQPYGLLDAHDLFMGRALLGEDVGRLGARRADEATTTHARTLRAAAEVTLRAAGTARCAGPTRTLTEADASLGVVFHAAR